MNAITSSITMSSLELVDFIDEQRAAGEPVLRHDNFMVKVPQVLGERGALKFKDTYVHPQNGQPYPCYRFPKRIACLLAVGLSRTSRKTRREVTGNRPIDVYDLIERDAHLVVYCYSDHHRVRVLDRWRELGAAPKEDCKKGSDEIRRYSCPSCCKTVEQTA